MKDSKKEKKCEKSKSPCGAEIKNEKKKSTESKDFYEPTYRQMDVSVSRFTDDIQTDIRIHRETGKTTDIYVSRGPDAWTVTPQQIHELPQDLQKEVRALLEPQTEKTRKSWLEFFSFWDSQRTDPSLLENRRNSSGTCE